MTKLKITGLGNQTVRLRSEQVNLSLTVIEREVLRQVVELETRLTGRKTTTVAAVVQALRARLDWLLMQQIAAGTPQKEDCGAPATLTLRNPVTGDMPEPMKVCEKCYVTIADTWPRCV